MAFTAQIHLDPHDPSPLAAQLAEQLTWLIASSRLRAGDKLPTIRTLADELGIHMHTVRDAYHRLEADQLVSIRVRRGTIVLPVQLNGFARQRSETPSNLVGVLLPRPVSIYNAYLEGLQQAAGDGGLLPFICFAHDNTHLTDRLLKQLLAKGVDGFIVTSTSSKHFIEHPELRESFPPIVFVDTPDIPGSLLPDSAGAALLAVKHLLQHGYESIGLLTCPPEWANVKCCCEGYFDALAEANMQPEERWMVEVPDFSYESGYAGAQELLQRGGSPRALFAIADALALGAQDAFQDAGLNVPTDIALASYNDIPEAAYAQPALTTAALPAFEMGVRAVELLMERMAGAPPPEVPTLLETELIIRTSCGCPPSVKGTKRREP